MSLQPRWYRTLSTTATVLLVSAGLAQAQAEKQKGAGSAKSAAGIVERKELKSAPSSQRAAGVIVKIEDLGVATTSSGRNKPKSSSKFRRITINMAAEWRDYVRDQATKGGEKSIKDVAAQGKKSVAAEGQPTGTDNVATVDLDASTLMELRYRASDDERSAGASTPGRAVEEEKESSTTKKGGTPKGGKATRLEMSNVKVGLFVEVDYRKTNGRDLATKLTVIEPIGGPNTPESDPSAARGKSKSATGKSK